MKKSALFILALVAGAFSLNAQVYTGTQSTVSFFSTTPVEDISATNSTAVMILNATTGDVMAKISIKGFVFSNVLMQEHFNENYMETDKEGPKDANGNATYPNRFATFKGKVNETIDYTKDGTHNITMTGTLTIHGVAQPRTLPGTLTVKGNEVTVDVKFDVALADHEIKVPEAVGAKIAEKIQVTVKSTLATKPKKK